MRNKVININKASWVLKILSAGYGTVSYTIHIGHFTFSIETNKTSLDWELGEILVKEMIKRDINWKFKFDTGKLIIDIW